MENEKPVLVVGGTGTLGGQVVTELLTRGKTVHALVRPSSDAGKLEAKGVTIVRGDMLDPASLVKAMTGVDAVITTAAGYTGHSKGDTADTDVTGNRNLVDAARQTGIRRFVLTSILTSDQTPQVPHFWHKKLTEDYLQEQDVPFVALRPGAFLEGVVSGNGPDENVRLNWFGDKDNQLTFVLSSQVARYLAEAVDAPVRNEERIDIGWDHPVSLAELEQITEKLLHHDITVLRIPSPIMNVVGGIVGVFSPFVKDMVSMGEWINTGNYVANITRQAELFDVPTAEQSMTELLTSRGYTVA